MAASTFFCINNFELDTHAFGHAGEMAIAIHCRFIIGESYATITMVVVDGIVRVCRQLLIELDRMTLQPDHGLCHAEIGDLGRGVPGSA